MKVVTAAIIIKDDTILLTRRGPSEKLSGYWEFPGGKVESSESLAECLTRELHEELGINVVVGSEVAESTYHYDHGSFQLIALRAEIVSGEIKLTVHDKTEWVPIAEVLSYQLAPADIPIAEVIQFKFGGRLCSDISPE